VYGTGSLITALSPNVTVLLIAGRASRGWGPVLVIPAIRRSTASNYSGHERALLRPARRHRRAGAAAGPLIGGSHDGAKLAAWFFRETVTVLGFSCSSKNSGREGAGGAKLDVWRPLRVGLGLTVFDPEDQRVGSVDADRRADHGGTRPSRVLVFSVVVLSAGRCDLGVFPALGGS